MAAPVLQQIHARERAFFDDRAQQRLESIDYLDRCILHRYSGRLRSYFANEFALSLAGELSGKTVLDVGCGEGRSSILFARLGADVTGIDISEGAIGVAKRRAAQNRVAAQFYACPIEQLEGGRRFDVVWVEAILHHLLHDLDTQIGKLARLVARGGVIIIREPVSLSPTFRRLRLRFGPPPDATPDERPLEHADIDIIRRHLPGLNVRLFGIVGRVADMMVRRPLESVSAPVRVAYHCANMLDRPLLSIPGISVLASSAVMWSTRADLKHA